MIEITIRLFGASAAGVVLIVIIDAIDAIDIIDTIVTIVTIDAIEAIELRVERGNGWRIGRGWWVWSGFGVGLE